MKPLATLNRPVARDGRRGDQERRVSFKERTDVTAVPAMGVVAETMMALVLAERGPAQVRGDSLAEFLRNHAGYLTSLGETASAAS